MSVAPNLCCDETKNRGTYTCVTQQYWSGLPFPSPGDLPNPGLEPGSPALRAGSVPFEPPGKSGNDLK